MVSSDTLSLIALSGFGAGLVAIGATLAIERLGGRLGGVIGTLPTTIIPASWGMWLTITSGAETDMISPKQVSYFAYSMYAVPVGMGLNALFLWLWRVIPEFTSLLSQDQRGQDEPQSKTQVRDVSLMSALTLSAWLVGALLWVWIARDLATSVEARAVSAICVTLTMVALGLIVTAQHIPAPRGSRPVSLSTLIMRGLAAAIAVSSAVMISKAGSPTLAGVASVFPAIFWTAMVSLWLSQGRAVPTGAVGPMMLGSSSVSVFAMLAPTLYPLLGPGLGSLCAWLLAALAASIPSYIWLGRRGD